MSGAICGSANPDVGTRVPLRRQLHDNGFGFCGLFVHGLYGSKKRKPDLFATFSAYPSDYGWLPNEFGPRSLMWLERRLAKWDQSWPDAEWTVRLSWPWQSETWKRVAPKEWIVTRSTDRGVVD